MAELNGKSVRELRAILNVRGVSYSECIEKSDLIQRILDTTNLEPLPGTVTSISRSIGGLSCKIVQNSAQPDYVVVLSHGYGANADDLAPIATNVLEIPALKTKKFWFVLPNAPVALPQGGRGWWNIDLQELIRCAMSGQLDQIMKATPLGMVNARESLLSVLAELKKELTSVPWSRFVIGGFSQGAILSVDVSLHLKKEESDAINVVCWSGGLMCRQEWEKLFDRKKNINVLMSHGTQDPILPFLLGKSLEQFLRKNDISVEFISFDGGHQIPAAAITRFVQLLENLQ